MSELAPQSCNFPYFVLIFLWCNKYAASQQQSVSRQQLCIQKEIMTAFNAALQAPCLL